MSLALGPFDLLEPIGKGGMAVVWKGVHRAQRIPVAVKVLSPPPGDAPDGLRAFRQEVRAVGALDHPGIVWIFDHGELPEETARASAGRLQAGAPYLVMELASQGTLRSLGRATARDATRAPDLVEPTGPTDGPHVAPLGWPRLRGILLSLLDALAHAHARGVLHRDLKPDNVLLCGPQDLRPGVKLSDFGIARPLDDDFELEEKPVGTPQYMAPEQLRNDRDAFGPPTDLYALGHLAWRMATGRLAWHGLSGPSLMYAQLRKTPPPFSPLFAVPDGFEGILRTLLEKEPHARFQCAADVALALARLPRSDGDGSGNDTGATETGTLRIVIGGGGGDHSLGPEIRPALPQTFVGTSPRPVRLLGAGLGMFGLRPVPFVAREAELQRAWRELVRVHADGRARVVVVRGGPGVGKTRFLQHIAERAHELGAASVLHASAGSGSALDRLVEPLVRFLHAHPLPPDVRTERFGDLLRGLDVQNLRVADAIGLLLDAEELELPEVQRFAVLRRTLEVVAKDRPLIVTCDDADDSPDVFRLARHLLDARDRSRAPVLLLVSLGEEASDPEVQRSARNLDLHDAAASVKLAPFAGPDRRAFVRGVAALTPELEQRIAARTEGNAVHGVQWVSDLVARDRLVPTEAGYTLGPAEHPEDDDVAEVWDRRIRTVVRGIPAPAMSLLERAAVGGVAVDVFEWQAACDDADATHAAQGRAMFNPRLARVRAAITEALIEQGLARQTVTGFVFTHRDLARALANRARSAGRHRGHAAAYGAILEHRATDGSAGRCARFLVDAGEPLRALPWLLRAESSERRRRGPGPALATLDVAESVLRGARVVDSDPRWSEVWARRAEAHEAAGDWPSARRAAGEAHLRARAHGHAAIDARAQMVLGAVAAWAGERTLAADHLERVVRLLGDDGPVEQTVRAWRNLRRLASAQRQRAEVVRCGGRIAEASGRATTDTERITAWLALAEHLVDGVDAAAGASAASQVVELANERRDATAAAKAWSLLAEVAELGSDFAGARDAWVQATELLEDVGDERRAVFTRARCGFAELRRGDPAAARAAVEPASRTADADRRCGAAMYAVLAAAAAGRGDFAAFDREIERAAERMSAVPAHEVVYAAGFLFVADRCRDANHPARERRSCTLARDRLVAAGRTAEARDVVARLDTIR